MVMLIFALTPHHRRARLRICICVWVDRWTDIEDVPTQTHPHTLASHRYAQPIAHNGRIVMSVRNISFVLRNYTVVTFISASSPSLLFLAKVRKEDNFNFYTHTHKRKMVIFFCGRQSTLWCAVRHIAYDVCARASEEITLYFCCGMAAVQSTSRL